MLAVDYVGMLCCDRLRNKALVLQKIDSLRMHGGCARTVGNFFQNEVMAWF